MNKQILLKAVFVFLSVLAFNAGAADAVVEPKTADAAAESKADAPKKDAKTKSTSAKKTEKAKSTSVKKDAKSKPAPAEPAKKAAEPAKVAAEPAKVAAAEPAKVAAAPAAAAAAESVPPSANTFNRLLRKPSALNLSPAEDGIHDSAKQGTNMLQTPLEAFAALPKSTKGNRVDWMKAIEGKQITPRADINDPNVKMKTKNLDVVIPVKGSMPNVLFSHAQHTQWLACANCHPDLFDEEAGSNPMNMATFSQGERCGVCHNKVAFPLADCRRCHNTVKPAPASASAKP